MSSMHKMMKKSKLQYEPKKRSTASGRDGRGARLCPDAMPARARSSGVSPG